MTEEIDKLDVPDSAYTDKWPFAEAVVTREGRIWRITVPVCPLCGCEHLHGGGVSSDPKPAGYLGHRGAHCGPEDRVEPDGYHLVEVGYE